jgi:hypothetical protein
MTILLEILLWQAPITFVAAGLVTSQFVVSGSLLGGAPLLACLYFLFAWMVAAVLVLTADLLVLLVAFVVVRLLAFMVAG